MKLLNYVSKTFIVMAFSMLCSFVATLKLGESLSTENFGFFNLLKRIFPMGAAIILIGVDKSYIKYFSKNLQMKILKFITPMIVLNASIITFLLSYLYNFNGYDISILFCLLTFAFTLFLSSYVRLNDQYGVAQFIQAGHKIIFFVLVFYLFRSFDINSFGVINIYLVSFLIPSFYIIKYIFDESKFESSISFTQFRKLVAYGFLFFSVNILNLMIINLEGLFIPYYYGQEANGIYSGLSFIYITVFVMIGTSIGYVLFPMLSKKEKIDIKSLTIYTGIGIFVILFLFIAFGYSINSLAFKGKFDIYRTPVVDMMIISIGALQFINGLLHWFILGLGTKENIMNYLKVIIALLLAYFTLILFVAHYSIKEFYAIIPIVLIAWIVKVLATLVFIRKNRIIKDYHLNELS